MAQKRKTPPRKAQPQPVTKESPRVPHSQLLTVLASLADSCLRQLPPITLQIGKSDSITLDQHKQLFTELFSHVTAEIAESALVRRLGSATVLDLSPLETAEWLCSNRRCRTTPPPSAVSAPATRAKSRRSKAAQQRQRK